jgi:hypothetical protein
MLALEDTEELLSMRHAESHAIVRNGIKTLVALPLTTHLDASHLPPAGVLEGIRYQAGPDLSQQWGGFPLAIRCCAGPDVTG